MEGVDFTPKGSDGASTSDMPTNTDIDDGIATFVKMAALVDKDELSAAELTWSEFADRVGDRLNAYALFVHGGIFCTAVAVRAYSGDPDPMGPPTGEMDILTVARNATNGEFLDLDAATVAGTVIAYACNWEWDKVNELMQSRVQNPNGNEFLWDLGAVLTTVFIGVNGLGQQS